MKLRALERRDVEIVAVLLHETFRRAALEHGAPVPWPDTAAAERAVLAYLAADPQGAGIVADADGAIAGCGFLRRRGEAATIGPIASASPGRGTGGKILDELIARAEGAGTSSLRLFQDGWNPDSFALYAGRSFAVVDVVACVERTIPPPKVDSSRGLEVTAYRALDLAELAALDLRLTGLERREDLAATVKLVARRRGQVVGFLGAAGAALGPALALDAADLGMLIARALPDLGGKATARLSTAAPTAMLMALGLGFRVTSVGNVMVRGLAPPARPPQLFSIAPEIL